MTFESLELSPFCTERPSVRYLNVLTTFSVPLWLKPGKICKNYDHTRKLFEKESG